MSEKPADQQKDIDGQRIRGLPETEQSDNAAIEGIRRGDGARRPPVDRHEIHPPMLAPSCDRDVPGTDGTEHNDVDRIPTDDGTTFGEVMRLYAIVSEVLQFFMERFGILGLIMVLALLIATTVWTSYNYLSGGKEQT
jgi:hypothetical protein